MSKEPKPQPVNPCDELRDAASAALALIREDYDGMPGGRREGNPFLSVFAFLSRIIPLTKRYVVRTQ